MKYFGIGFGIVGFFTGFIVGIYAIVKGAFITGIPCMLGGLSSLILIYVAIIIDKVEQLDDKVSAELLANRENKSDDIKKSTNIEKTDNTKISTSIDKVDSTKTSMNIGKTDDTKTSANIDKSNDKNVSIDLDETDDKNISTSYVSKTEYAIKLLKNEEYSTAITYLVLAAKEGDVTSYVYLGNCYMLGYGTEVDKKKAVNWFEKASNAGIADGKYLLGLAYLHGDGVEKDVDYAIKLINDAAELGSVKAKDYIINHKI